MEFRGMMGGFYKLTEWIMRFAVINLLWLVCASPFMIVVMSMLITVPDAEVPQPPNVQSLLWLPAILMPITLFPATAAMFTVARKWVTGEPEVPLLKTFFKGYKSNFKQSVIGGFIYLAFFVIIYVNYQFYLHDTGILRYLTALFVSFFIIVFVSVFNFFSIMAHYHMELLQIVKNALLITIGNPLRSILLLGVNGVIIWLSLTQMTFLIPFFMGSTIAFMSYWHFNAMFHKIIAKHERLEKMRAEQAAEEAVEQTAKQ